VTLPELPESSSPQDLLTFLQRAFHASLSALPGRGVELLTNGTYGRSLPEYLAKFDRASHSLKTSQACFPWIPDASSMESSLTWPRSGLMLSGTAYPLAPLVRIIDETGCGFVPTVRANKWGLPDSHGSIAAWQKWPTPRAQERSHFQRDGKQKGKERPTLSGAVQMWPTPRANDPEKRGDFDPTNPRNGLPAAVMMLPTPCSRDFRTGMPGRIDKGHTLNLPERLADMMGTPGQLNPTWVEWLMGYPSEWTALKASETPSSQKSPTSKSKQLPN